MMLELSTRSLGGPIEVQRNTPSGNVVLTVNGEEVYLNSGETKVLIAALEAANDEH